MDSEDIFADLPCNFTKKDVEELHHWLLSKGTTMPMKNFVDMLKREDELKGKLT